MRETLKWKVEQVLRDVPKTRDDDTSLHLNLLWKFHNSAFVEIGEKKYIIPEKLSGLPSESDVSRIRRKFNEEGFYVSDKPEVLAARAKKEQRVQKEIVKSNWENAL